MDMMNHDLPLFGTAVILAGGKSSRMGFDKQLLTENDRPILEQVIATLKEEFPDILIVTAKPELYEGMDVRICSDRYRERGPLAGVHAALEHARSRYIYLIACDMPVVCLPFIRHMKQRLLETGAEICACRIDHRLETFNAFYSRTLLPDVVNRLETGNASLFRFIDGNRACEIPLEDAIRYDKELRMFMNINTPGEYGKYLGSDDATPEVHGSVLTGKREIVRYIHEAFVPMQDLMVQETALQLEIPGVYRRTLYCSPAQLQELVIGHLYTQGYIRSVQDMASVEIDETAGTATVKLASSAPAQNASQKEPLSDSLMFDPKILLQNQEQFYAESTLQKATAGTHRSALCDDSGTHIACVDISRHNTIDKLVGTALLAGVSLTDKYIITSGRIPMDMIQKAAAIRIPMIVSRSTPTIAAVDVAKAANITLLGFSRENRFNIYTAPTRLKGYRDPSPTD